MTKVTEDERPVIDGRRARRERGRVAVTDAMIALVMEGNIPPTADQVAERAGVSVASIFRYFETLDDLRQATTAVYFERYAHLFEIPNLGQGTTTERIASLVSSRIDLYETNEPMARLVRLRAPELAQADDLIHRVRATRADQVRRHFDEDLATLGRAARDDLVAVIATMTSFESWDQARHDHGRSANQLRRAWTTALTRLLST